MRATGCAVVFTTANIGWDSAAKASVNTATDKIGSMRRAFFINSPPRRMFLQCLPWETACRTRCKIERFRTARSEVKKARACTCKPTRPEGRNPQWDLKQEHCTAKLQRLPRKISG